MIREKEFRGMCRPAYDPGPMQIIILGMHRSGTSAATGLLTSMGAYFGPDSAAMPAQPDNPRGFWERADVVAADDVLLAAAGAAWNTPLRYEREKVPRALLDAILPRMRAIAGDLSDRPVSVVKDPRMCLTLREWAPLFPRPVCVFLHRNPLAIARSLQKRGDCSIMTGLALWEAYVRAALRNVRGLPLVALRYDRLLEAPAEELGRLLEALRAIGPVGDLAVPGDTVLREMVHAGLRHHEATREDLAAYATPAQMALFDELAGRPLDAIADAPVSPPSVDALQYFAEHEHVLQTALQDALLQLAAFGTLSLKDIAGLQTKTERVCAHRDALRSAIGRLMAEAQGAQQLLADIGTRPELRSAFWLSRFARRQGVTIADLSAAAGRLAASWSLGRDALDNSVDEPLP